MLQVNHFFFNIQFFFFFSFFLFCKGTREFQGWDRDTASAGTWCFFSFIEAVVPFRRRSRAVWYVARKVHRLLQSIEGNFNLEHNTMAWQKRVFCLSCLIPFVLYKAPAPLSITNFYDRRKFFNRREINKPMKKVSEVAAISTVWKLSRNLNNSMSSGLRRRCWMWWWWWEDQKSNLVGFPLVNVKDFFVCLFVCLFVTRVQQKSSARWEWLGLLSIFHFSTFRSYKIWQ